MNNYERFKTLNRQEMANEIVTKCFPFVLQLSNESQIELYKGWIYEWLCEEVTK